MKSCLGCFHFKFLPGTFFADLRVVIRGVK